MCCCFVQGAYRPEVSHYYEGFFAAVNTVWFGLSRACSCLQEARHTQLGCSTVLFCLQDCSWQIVSKVYLKMWMLADSCALLLQGGSSPSHDAQSHSQDTAAAHSRKQHKQCCQPCRACRKRPPEQQQRSLQQPQQHQHSCKQHCCLAECCARRWHHTAAAAAAQDSRQGSTGAWPAAEQAHSHGLHRRGEALSTILLRLCARLTCFTKGASIMCSPWLMLQQCAW